MTPKLRIARLIAIVAIVATAFTNSPAQTNAADGYNDACASNPGTNGARTWMIKSKYYDEPYPLGEYTGSIRGARARLRIGANENANPCFNPSSNRSGFFWQGISMEGYNSGEIVQIGFGRGSGEGSGDLLIKYTASDDTGGNMTGEWQPFTVTDYTTYFFQISKIGGTSNPEWDLCVTNITAGGQWCKEIERTWSTAKNAWWGFETQNYEDQMGYKDGQSANYMWDMQYQRSQDDAWYRRSGFADCTEFGDYTNAPKNYYQCVASTTDVSYDTIRAYTELHTVSS